MRTQPLPVSGKNYTVKDYERAVNLAKTNSYSVKAKKGHVNHRAQLYHSAGIAIQKTGSYGGSALGTAALAPMGPIAAAVGGFAGQVAGEHVANHVIDNSSFGISKAQYMSLTPRDRALMAKRERNVETIDFVVNLAMLGHTFYKINVARGGTAGFASKVRNKKAARVRASTHGLPSAGQGSAGNFTPRRAPRYGANKGVYNITTGMSGTRLR